MVIRLIQKVSASSVVKFQHFPRQRREKKWWPGQIRPWVCGWSLLVFPQKLFRVVALCCSFHCSSAWSSWGYWFKQGELTGLMILSLRLSASFCFLGLHPLGLNVIKIAENTANNKRSSTFQRLMRLPGSLYRSEWNSGPMKSVLTSC